MKKRMLLFITTMLVLMVILIGCGSSEKADPAPEATTEQYFADDDFMKSLAQGLEARWDINDDLAETDYYTNKHKEQYMSCVNAELDVLEKYTTEPFKNTTLQELAIKYINALKDQKTALDYVTVDSEKYEEDWGKAYDERSKLISEFVNNYGLTVSEKYADTLNNFKINSQLVTNKEQNEAAVKKMVDSIKFKKEKEEYDWKTYTGVVENTTETDIKTLELNINLLDEDGVIVDSLYDSVNNLKKGQKARLEFGTDKEFEETSLEISYWE